ncbi:YHS domain-containing (seleno)protein [Yoonia sp. 2307UL14-13]|uniref:YHS domain-containing (seleno)protein n=1 Tax=Yoonia sp. 2307UL14-13 TaxID=3126506 RepID=UPI0030B76BA2
MLTRRAVMMSAIAIPFLANAAIAEPKWVYAPFGFAIGGIDPVAYFRTGAVVEGSHSESVTWRGARWCFDNSVNREAFERDPHAFAPRYGGHCALALSSGALAPSDPEAWTIYDGELFLNHSLTAREVWLRDSKTHVAQADRNWQRFVWG